MTAWAQVQVNGALADSLVTNFGALAAPSIALPPDQSCCLVLHYSAVATGQVRIWLAIAAAVADDQIVMVYDSATQLPVANSTQFTANVILDMPIRQGVLLYQTLRITKSNTNAAIWWKIVPNMGPGC